MHADYTYDLAYLTNPPTQVKYLLHSIEGTARGIGFYMKSDKTDSICDISTLNAMPLKSVNHFLYFDSNIHEGKV